METNNGVKVSLHSVSSLFSDTVMMYQERFTALSEIVLLPALVMLLGYALEYLGGPFFLLGLLALIIGAIVLIFSQLALVFSIHHNTGVDASYKATTRFFWPYIWISILGGLAVLGGGVMLIIPGIWLTFALALKTYTLVLENRKGIDALRQSKDYIKGYWWALLGRTLLLVIVFVVIAIVIKLPFRLIGAAGLGSVISTIVSIFILPFAAIFYYKIYENLRTLKPEVVESHPAHGGFIKVSSIVGLVASVVIVIVGIAGIAYAIHHPDVMKEYMHQNSNMNWQYQPSNNY